MTITSVVEPINEQALVDKYNVFRKELKSLLNRNNMENSADTPDFILAEYLTRCLVTFDACVRRREQWYNRRYGNGAAIHGDDVIIRDPRCQKICVLEKINSGLQQ